MGSTLGVAKTAARKVGCTVEEWLARRADGERWCSKCRAWWVIENMAPDRNRPDGISCYCRACTVSKLSALDNRTAEAPPPLTSSAADRADSLAYDRRHAPEGATTS